MVEPAQHSLSTLRLCQLVSPALPIGAYNFSQGLEYAVHMNWVHDEDSLHAWIAGIAQHSVGTLDLPVLSRLHTAWIDNDELCVQRWSWFLIASRESEELRAEERHLGRSLAKVLIELGVAEAATWIKKSNATYAGMFALAAARWSLPAAEIAQGYLWAWCENQVIAALKLLPLGQSAGQRILNRLLQDIPVIVSKALAIDDDDIGIATPMLGMASAWHENQYTRLFRS